MNCEYFLHFYPSPTIHDCGAWRYVSGLVGSCSYNFLTSDIHTQFHSQKKMTWSNLAIYSLVLLVVSDDPCLHVCFFIAVDYSKGWDELEWDTGSAVGFWFYIFTLVSYDKRSNLAGCFGNTSTGPLLHANLYSLHYGIGKLKEKINKQVFFNFVFFPITSVKGCRGNSSWCTFVQSFVWDILTIEARSRHKIEVIR